MPSQVVAFYHVVVLWAYLKWLPIKAMMIEAFKNKEVEGEER